MNRPRPENTPKVSVTVPVYNTEQYLRQCLDSLAAQTLGQMEVVIVDDGSTDGSPAIIEEYCRRYPNFRSIRKENGGLASARQAGLDAARGEFVIVCDSDDWADPDMYQSLYDRAVETGADIVCCGMTAEYDNGTSREFNSFLEETDGFVAPRLILAHAPGMSYTKLVRRSLYAESGTSYEPGINMSEDVLITFRLLRSNPRIAQLKRRLYHWRRVAGGGSYTNSVRMTHIRQMRFTLDWIKQNYPAKEYSDIIRNRTIDLAFACLRASDFNALYFKSLIKTELPLRELISHIPNLKTLVVLSGIPFSGKAARILIRLLYPLFYR